MTRSINPDVSNAISCEMPSLVRIESFLQEKIPGIKFYKDYQLQIITNEHNIAHRNLHENFKKITDPYFLPYIKK